MAKTAVACAKLANLGGGEVQSALAFHPLPVMEEPGGDASASSDADQGKQQLWSRTFLPIPIFPITVSRNPLLCKKLTLMPQSAGQSWEGYNFQFGQLIGNTMTGQHSTSIE